MKITPRVRKFRPEDMDKVLEIEAQAFPKTVYPREIFLTYAKVLPEGFIVAEMGEDMAGYMIFDPNGHVHSTAVKTTQRRQGLGRVLFMHASNHARARLWLEVRSKNRDAVLFYKSLGMKIIGRIPDYYDSDDALLMVLDQRGQPEREAVGR
ncbi:MAG: GNAT family N-acetyltransferase [Desulfobacterales bacterium]|nr:GNAT family N-acetyltransferase [Desulfobacterales bacterium]